MSDSEDDAEADDGFDKEAERERLREKYERDQERREATEKMSELLLQGATMTNKHCDSCGSPVFRYDGEEFCPTCGGTTAVPGDDTNASDDDSGRENDREPQQTDGRDPQETATGIDRPDSGPANAPRGGQGDADPDDAPPRSGRGGSDTDPTDLEVARPSDRPRRSSRNEDRAVDDGPSSDVRTGRDPTGGIDRGVEEAPSLAQARASLRRAIVSLSEQAAQSDDPVRAKNLLEAANEGAEALSELGGDEV